MNILLLLTDQWPATHFGHRGWPIATPRVDALARSGTRFENAYTSCPLCSPARGTLLTGLRPWRSGMVDNFGVGYSLQRPLDPSLRTWIEAGVDAGYRVGYFGKWHLGPDGPRQRGAAESSAGIDAKLRPLDAKPGGHSYAAIEARYREERRGLVSGQPPFYGEISGGREQTHAFGVVEEVRGFLQRRDRRPFLLTASFVGPHFPHYLPRDDARRYRPEEVLLPASLHDDFGGKPWFHRTAWWPSMDTSPFDEAEWRRAIAHTWGHMTMVDEALGQVLDLLDDHGLGDDTAVVFAADHGDVCGEHNRFDKGPYFYEEVLRIPLIIQLPGARPAVNPTPVSFIDIGTTLLHLLGDGDPQVRLESAGGGRVVRPPRRPRRARQPDRPPRPGRTASRALHRPAALVGGHGRPVGSRRSRSAPRRHHCRDRGGGTVASAPPLRSEQSPFYAIHSCFN